MSVVAEEYVCLPDYNRFQLIRAFSCLIYAIPSISIYILVIYVIRTNKTYFSPTFLHIFTLNFIFSISCWLLDLIFTRIFALSNICPLIQQLTGTYYLSFPYFLYNFFLVANLLSSTIIVFHQFTATVYPLHVTTIWKKSSRRITLATTIIPGLCAFHIFLGTTEILPLYSGQVYIKVVHFYHNFELITAPSVNAISGILTSLLIVSFIIVSSITAFKQRNDMNLRKINLKNYMISCWIGVSAILFAIYNIALWYARFILNDPYAIDRVIIVRGIVADVCFLPLPWVVLIAKKPIRFAIVNIFKKKSSSIHVSTHF